MSLSDAKDWIFRILGWVSILVLMDESFRRKYILMLEGWEEHFHPCFNGWVFQTIEKASTIIDMDISILVLMDESFRQITKYTNRFIRRVSILVLMDVSFRLFLAVLNIQHICLSFHPCFNGCVFQTEWNCTMEWKTRAKFPSLF